MYQLAYYHAGHNQCVHLYLRLCQSVCTTSDTGVSLQLWVIHRSTLRMMHLTWNRDVSQPSWLLLHHVTVQFYGANSA